MTRVERKRLNAVYRQKLERAARLALDDKDPGALRSAVEELDSYSKVQNRFEGHWAADWKLALAIAAACLAVTSWLWTSKVPRTTVSMTVDTEALRGTLDRDWHIESPFQASALHLENLSMVEAPNLGLSFHQTSGDIWFKLEGGQISLGSLQIDKGAYIQMTSAPSELSVFITIKPLRGTITVLGRGTLTTGDKPGKEMPHRAYNLEIPETINFAARDPKGIPARISIHAPQNKWSLGRAPFRDLGFALEETRDLSESELVSGIKSGTVHFNETSWPVIDLAEDQIVSAHNTERARVEVRAGEHAIHVTLNGAVKDVCIGDSETRHELAPSRLEDLYNKKSLTVFWGAIVFVWGVLWGIRKTIFR